MALTLEQEVAALSAAVTAQTNAVGNQQLLVTAATNAIAGTTARVNALNLVENTADANKPINTVTMAALLLKQDTLVSGLNISTVNGMSLLGGTPLIIERSATSLNRLTYDNRGTLRTLTPQLDDATLVESIGLFMWVDTQLEPDDDETCINTVAGQWLLQAPAWDYIDAINFFDKSILDDWMEDEPIRFAAHITNQI